jgi:hypothetical protein
MWLLLLLLLFITNIPEFKIIGLEQIMSVGYAMLQLCCGSRIVHVTLFPMMDFCIFALVLAEVCVYVRSIQYGYCM